MKGFRRIAALIEQRVRLYLTENVDGKFLGRTEEMSEEVRQALARSQASRRRQICKWRASRLVRSNFRRLEKGLSHLRKAFSFRCESDCRLGDRVGNFRAAGFRQSLRIVIFPQPIV